MTVSILDALSILPSGKLSGRLTYEELSSYLQKYYGTDSEKKRNAHHCLRDELYRDGGEQHMRSFISRVFKDPLVRELRLEFVKYANYNNPTKRIVNEIATTYSESAKRIVPNGNDNYQELLTAVRMNERALEIDRLLELHGALLVGFRVGEKPDGTRYPALDIATPANVRAVMHPNDDTEVIGWMIRCSHKSVRPSDTGVPAWVLWTDHESLYLRDDLSVISDSYQEHNFGVCPWVPVSIMPPCPGFWPGNYGADLVSGHISIWFQSVLSLKESKSATKQTVISGDGTSMARGQAADTEVPNELSDGQSVTTVDMSMDLSMFQDLENHILYGLGHNRGMSPAIVDHQGVQSAEARQLMMQPLREIRRRRQVPLRIFEENLAMVMSIVCASDLPDYAFDPINWRIEFAESEVPLDPVNEMMLFERQRAAGLTNTVEFIQKKRPGISEDDALDLIRDNVRVELERNVAMRPLQSIQGTLDAAIEGAAAGARVDAAAVIDDGSGQAQPPNTATPSGRPDTRTVPPPKKPGSGASGAPVQAA